jgi:hypothetical protein
VADLGVDDDAVFHRNQKRTRTSQALQGRGEPGPRQAA